MIINDKVIGRLKYWVAVGFLLMLNPAYGGDSTAISLQFRQHAGFIADVSQQFEQLVNGYVYPVEIGVEWQPNDQRSQFSLMPRTYFGASLYYANLRNSQVLGSLFYPSMYVKVVPYRTAGFSSYITASLGTSIVSKYFHPVENYKNTLFSKTINAGFGFKGGLAWHINKQHVADLSLIFNHFSNGETSSPNKGMNIASIALGYQYLLHPEMQKQTEKPSYKRQFHFAVLQTVGRREVSFKKGKFTTLSTNAEVSYKITGLSNLSFGACVFYDESAIEERKRLKDTISDWQTKQVPALYLGHQADFYPLYIIFHMGRYFNKEVLPEHEYFNHLGIRYFLSRKLFFNFTHKSNFFFKGTNLEWGLGYRF